MSRKSASTAVIEKQRADGKSCADIAADKGTSRQNISERLREAGRVKVALDNLPPLRYGVRLYDKHTGEKYFIVGKSAKLGAVRVHRDSAGFLDAHDVSILQLTTLPPAPVNEPISKRLEGLSQPDPGRSYPLGAGAVAHAMRLAEQVSPGSQSTKQDRPDPDTNLRATQEQKQALRREAEQERTGKPFVLLIKNDTRKRDTGRKKGGTR